MIKKLLSLVLVLMMCIPFSGCLGRNMYKQKEADRIKEKTAEIMQVWIDQNLPGASLGNCAAYDILCTDFKRYLTDFGVGFVYGGGEELLQFTVNTVSGEIYLDRNLSRMSSAAEKYFCEVMGVVPINTAGERFSCCIMVPLGTEASDRAVPGITHIYVNGVPEYMTAPEFDMDAYVRNPEARQLICINKAEWQVADDIDLAQYDLAAMERLGAACGMQIGSVILSNTNQYFEMHTPRYNEFLSPDYTEQPEATFRESGTWLAGDGFRISGQIRERIESVDADTHEHTATDRQFAPQTDFVFEETEHGYRYFCLTDDWDYSFILQAEEGAEILRYDYIVYSIPDDRYEDFVAGHYDIPMNAENGEKAAWTKQADGTYRLVSADDSARLTFSRAGSLERVAPNTPLG